MLPTKEDKQEFDNVFDNVRLYSSYLGNASNPIPLESVSIGAIFHNYKQLLQITKEDTIPISRSMLNYLSMFLL